MEVWGRSQVLLHGYSLVSEGDYYDFGGLQNDVKVRSMVVIKKSDDEDREAGNNEAGQDGFHMQMSARPTQSLDPRPTRLHPYLFQHKINPRRLEPWKSMIVPLRHFFFLQGSPFNLLSFLSSFSLFQNLFSLSLAPIICPISVWQARTWLTLCALFIVGLHLHTLAQPIRSQGQLY